MKYEIFLFSRTPKLFRSVSPRGPQNFAAVGANPIDALPHTNFSDIHKQQQQQHQVEQHINFPPPVPQRTSCFSPQLTRDTYQMPNEDENVAIQNQVRDLSNYTKILFDMPTHTHQDFSSTEVEQFFLSFASMKFLTIRRESSQHHWEIHTKSNTSSSDATCAQMLNESVTVEVWRREGNVTSRRSKQVVTFHLSSFAPD